LRAQQATREVPILMISAIRNFKEQAYKAGVNYCLEKPFQMKELLSLVARYTGNGGN
jgi:CheY-like chemotaxis protein